MSDVWDYAWKNFGLLKQLCDQGEELSKSKSKSEPQIRPQIGIALIIRKNGKVLIHKRKGKHAPGTWAFVGGHQEKWESFEETAIREMKEEAGDLQVTTPVFWTAVNTVFPEEDKHYVVLMMISDWISGEPKVMEPKKCECWEWCGWDELPEPLMQGLKILKDKGLNPINVKGV